MKIKNISKIKKFIQKLNRILILIIAVELLYLFFLAFKFYRKKTAPGITVKTELKQCLQEGRRYTIDEAIQDSRSCNVEINAEEDLAKMATASVELTNVQSIYFRKTKNTNLPAEIGNLKNLTVLIFHHTFNTSLPSEIGRLKKLAVLKLDQADIEDIPPEIGNLENLTSLIIINNAKKFTLPLDIEKLKRLENLDLSNNNLTKLPDGIEKLIKLKYLNLSGNQMNREDIEKLKQWLPNAQIFY